MLYVLGEMALLLLSALLLGLFVGWLLWGRRHTAIPSAESGSAQQNPDEESRSEDSGRELRQVDRSVAADAPGGGDTVVILSSSGGLSSPTDYGDGSVSNAGTRAAWQADDPSDPASELDELEP